MGIWSRFTTSLGFGRREPVTADLPGQSSPKRGPAAGRQVAPSDDLWIDHPGFGLVPMRLVRIFRAAEQGDLAPQAALFDDQIEADGHVRSLFESIETAVYGKPIVLVADAPDEVSTLMRDVLWRSLDRMPEAAGLRAFVQHQSTRWRGGYSPTEIEWGVIEEDGREWVVPLGLHSVEPRRFRLDVKTKSFRLLTAAAPATGQELLPGKWVIGTVSATDIPRSGKMRTSARNCLLKSSSVTNWAVYGNKFGIPLALVKYDDTDGGGDNSKKNAEEIARSIGSDAAAAVPKSVEIDIVEAGRMGDSSPLHGGMVAYLNAENSKLIAGGTLTNDSSGSSSQSQGAGSSHALGKVHENGRWAIITTAAAAVQETFYEISKLFVAFNGLTGKGAPPRMQIQVAREWTPATIVQAAAAMVNELGAPVSLAQLYTDTGFTAPENPEDATPGRKAKSPAEQTPPGGTQ
jgi:phage gp29-like protein